MLFREFLIKDTWPSEFKAEIEACVILSKYLLQVTGN